jgi:small GTP-binding protein
MQILSERQEALLKEERQFLGDLRVALAAFGAAPEDQQTLADSIEQLDDFFLLVVVGEFNAGKSAFINALLGDAVLEEGEVPTTAQVQILRHGHERQRTVISDQLHVLTAPVPMLRELSIVDTPGTNSIIQRHQEITSRFVPRSDLVLFVTSADRPFTESERIFLERIRDWGKKVTVVINKIDILRSEAALESVRRFVEQGVRDTLGLELQILPVSALLAQQAKHGHPERWQQSRFEPLERYIHDTLDESGRLHLKLESPLGVGLFLVDKYLAATNQQMSLLQEDLGMLQDVESQLTVYQEDMERDFGLHMKGIENVLYEMERRGRDYFEETFRLRRVLDLLDKKRIEREFQEQVVADVPQRVEQRVNELVDWVVESDLRQWQAVTDYLAERRRQFKARIVGEGGTGFQYDRARLFEGLGRQAQELVDGYDRVAEARQIAAGAQSAVAAVAALEVGAVGLGALVVALATTVAADVTGVLMASLVAFLGLFIIPNRRRQAEHEMRDKITAMRNRLAGALRSQFEAEMGRIMQRIGNTIAPYTRFVRAERDKQQAVQVELGRIRAGMTRLRVEVQEKSAHGGN